MADRVYLQLGDNDPVWVPADDDVVALFKARGFEEVDDPTPVGVADVTEPAAEVDDRGTGWLYVEQDIDGATRTIRIPNLPGVLEDHRERGWRLAGEPSQAEALDDRTVVELKAEIDRRNNEGREPPLLRSGTKQELIDRLKEDDDRVADTSEEL
jgi:hypothetical protein